MWYQPQYDVTDKNNNVSVDHLANHYLYHMPPYRTRRDTSNNVGLSFHNCRYYTYMTSNIL
jgi:hypothetical protein